MKRKMNPKIKKLWLKALRSGDYKQGRGYLRRGNDTFCCLGVLCNIHAQQNPDSELIKLSSFDRYLEVHTYGGVSAIPPEEVLKWAGINRKSVTIDDHTVTMIDHLWKRNDGVFHCKHTFEEIADIIEEHF